MKITSCVFQASAPSAQHEPRTQGPDIVFLGRSNVGKSSLINRLLGVRGLARTSSTPGRTQSVNFYRVNDTCHFIDLPGYGYAKAPESVRRSWGPMVEAFLNRRRENIALALLIVDARRTLTELDRVMGEWLEARGIPYLVVATKADKLSGNGRAKAARELGKSFAGAITDGPTLASVTSGLGIREVWRHLDAALP